MRTCIREFMADANLQDVGMQEDSFQTLVGCTLVRHNRRPHSSVRFLPCWVLAPNLAKTLDSAKKPEATDWASYAVQATTAVAAMRLIEQQRGAAEEQLTWVFLVQSFPQQTKRRHCSLAVWTVGDETIWCGGEQGDCGRTASNRYALPFTDDEAGTHGLPRCKPFVRAVADQDRSGTLFDLEQFLVSSGASPVSCIAFGLYAFLEMLHADDDEICGLRNGKYEFWKRIHNGFVSEYTHAIKCSWIRHWQFVSRFCRKPDQTIYAVRDCDRASSASKLRMALEFGTLTTTKVGQLNRLTDC